MAGSRYRNGADTVTATLAHHAKGAFFRKYPTAIALTAQETTPIAANEQPEWEKGYNSRYQGMKCP